MFTYFIFNVCLFTLYTLSKNEIVFFEFMMLFISFFALLYCYIILFIDFQNSNINKKVLRMVNNFNRVDNIFYTDSAVTHYTYLKDILKTIKQEQLDLFRNKGYVIVIGTYNELSKIAETIREEVRLINKSALVGNGVFAAKAKKALATTAKYTIKAGAMILLGAIGANIDGPDIDINIPIPNVDIPDFDIPDIDIPDINTPNINTPNIDVPDIDVPDIDVPDIDAAVDISTDLGSDFNIPETDLNYDTPDQGNAISFLGSSKSDGFIPDGTIKLERTISGTTDTFDLFTKGGHEYVKVNGCFIQIDGSGTVNINNIKYDKIG